MTIYRAQTARVRAAEQRHAIIDIGSNSIRLVVFDGPRRHPTVLFNEKVMAGLGRNLGRDGNIDSGSADVALRGLERFAQLARELDVASLRTVATAAVREARNGTEFLNRVAAIGLKVELLSGEEEAAAAGLGVVSGIPDADGIVGDLGGGSLELVRVKNGCTSDWVSLPLGVLRIDAIRKKGKSALRRTLAKMLDKHRWLGEARGLPLYMVGGSWRALARFDMHLQDYPLPIIHHYRMTSERATHLARSLSKYDRRKLQALPTLSGARIPTLGDAAALLSALVREIEPSELIVSAAGLREGLLFGMLDADERAEDPLIAAAREEGARQGRFAEHGDLLHRWIAQPFEDEPVEAERLRHMACLLADVAWRANPEFRAERGREIALHGNWVGIDAAGRAMVAQALATSFGAGANPDAALSVLVSEKQLRRAICWGLAMRLGQRISGGVARPLTQSKLAVADKNLLLTISRDHAMLYGDAVERRHRQLAQAMGLGFAWEIEG